MSKLLACVLQSYPDLDEEIAAYVGGMLDDDDAFDTVADVVDAVGPFLIDAAGAIESDVEILALKLFGMMDIKDVSFRIVSQT